VYLIDEALSVGDGVFKARADAIFEAKRKHASLVVVSHSIGTVRSLCDMGAVLSQGELRLYDDLEDAIKEYQVISRNLGTYE
jgi:capsular polysaccharide transport system ATP-binding protein